MRSQSDPHLVLASCLWFPIGKVRTLWPWVKLRPRRSTSPPPTRTTTDRGVSQLHEPGGPDASADHSEQTKSREKETLIGACPVGRGKARKYALSEICEEVLGVDGGCPLPSHQQIRCRKKRASRSVGGIAGSDPTTKYKVVRRCMSRARHEARMLEVQPPGKGQAVVAHGGTTLDEPHMTVRQRVRGDSIRTKDAWT